MNLQTGRFIYAKTDISIGDLKLTRSWGDTPSYDIPAQAFGALTEFSSDVGPNGWFPPNIGWSHNFKQGVYYWNGTSSSFAKLYAVVDSRLYTYVILSDGSIVPADQSTSGTNLVSVSGKWQLTDHSGAVFTFYPHPAINQYGFGGSPYQVIESAVYANGSRLDYSYTSAGQPRFIASNSGFAIGLEYNGGGNISAACGFNLAQAYADASTSCSSAPVKTSYGYDTSGTRLTSVTNTLSQVVTISYSGSSALPACVSLANSTTCEIQNVYGAKIGSFVDQVTTQTTATGAVWEYNYFPQPDPVDVPVVPGKPRYSHATMTDPNGRGSTVRFDRGHLVSQMTPTGAMEFRYKYRNLSRPFYSNTEPTTIQFHDNAVGMVISPEGNREYFVHDGRGNILEHSYWPKGAANPAAPSDPDLNNCCIKPDAVSSPTGSLTYTKVFPSDQGAISYYGVVFVLGCGSGPSDAKLCNKPTSETDPAGNTIDYTYDAAHGGVLTETLPTVNGVRPQTRYTYAQRYAWVKNSGGSYVAAATPVWVLTQKSFCKAGAASGVGCATGSDEVRTLYDYGPNSGPNNLLLRGVVDDSTGAALRTCYGYDAQGNRINETKPRAGLTSCP